MLVTELVAIECTVLRNKTILYLSPFAGIYSVVIMSALHTGKRI